MKRLIKNMVGILVVLLASTNVQAELQLVENFEGMSTTISPDGEACTGVMGGTLDTQSEGTGNIDIVDIDGSRVVTVIGHSSGNNARAFGFNGITNTIDNSETGIAFCRFWLRDTSRAARTYMGLISDATDNPITDTNADNPMSIPAGFSWVDNGSGGLDIVTTDGAIVLKAGLARGQWYNVWIVANNATDTFDLYLSEAEGPAGEATLPTPEDLVESNIPFGVATTEPLTGMIFANPTGTGQADRIYIDEIYWDGDQGLGKPTKARNSIPADEESDVPRDVIMGWTPAPFAATHNVYFGTSFDDVYNGIGGITQSAGSYTPPQRLDFDTTYYWRVDEVDAPPDSTVYRGSLWSFTTEPFAYPIENITATASSSDTAKGPENTVNGSGLDATGLLHTKTGDDNMWLSSMIGTQPTWIEYEFDKVYKLYEMWVWNSNDSLEPAIGFGFKDVTIEYSVNGTDYTTLGTTHEFARAPGLDDYAHNTTVDLNGALAKYVRLTANSNWGSILDQYGLSEVRFFYIPTLAREPNPDSGARDVSIGTIDEPVDVTLGFRAGREAARHDVYLSSDEQAVIDGTAPVATVTETSYGPLSLDLGMTYYWRVDEVNDAETTTTWKGDLWNFRTQEYFVVDDMESYNDINEGEPGSNRIYLAWLDGLDDPSNGSIIGYDNAPFAEQTIVHGGSQSMPFSYDNAVGYSEATMTLTNPCDWTKEGVGVLSLWFRGNPISFIEDPAGTFTISAAGTDIWDTADEFRFAYKQLSGAGSIVAQVLSVQNTDGMAKVGVMIRESLDPGSKHAFVCITPGNGVVAQARVTTDTNSASNNQTGITAPHWVKLERDAAGTFTASHSADGITWQPVEGDSPRLISMSQNVYIGLAMTSHNANITGTAEFANVQTTGSVSPMIWSHQAIGAIMLSNEPEPMYVALNGNAVVHHDNPNAAQINDWTEWNIDLTRFAGQGVNLANVNTITLGLGNRANPTAGGAGMMYFDDIRLYAP